MAFDITLCVSMHVIEAVREIICQCMCVCVRVRVPVPVRVCVHVRVCVCVVALPCRTYISSLGLHWLHG